METSNKTGKYKIIAVFLIVLCLVQGWIIFKYVINPSPNSNAFQDAEQFSSFLDNKFQKEKKESWNLYDQFFNDDFFLNENDPFKEMGKIQKRLEDMMGFNSRKTFKDSWKGWFDDRFIGGASEIDITTTEKNGFYEITIKIPNLKENKLQIDINKDGIAIDGEFSQKVEKKDSHGNIIGKHEIRQSLSRQIPVPEDVDTSKAKVENKKEKIIIKLPKVHS